MKRLLLILTLMTSLLVLTACDGEDTQTSITGAYLGGTQGIVAEFEPFSVEEDGVYSMFDTEPFPLEVTLFNKGEYEIQPGDVNVELKGPVYDFTGIASFLLQNEGINKALGDLPPPVLSDPPDRRLGPGGEDEEDKPLVRVTLPESGNQPVAENGEIPAGTPIDIFLNLHCRHHGG